MKKFTSKLMKIYCGLFFSLLTLTCFIIPAAYAATDWDNLSYEVSKMMTVRTGWLNALRSFCYGLMTLMCTLIDMFDDAVAQLINLNLYTFIKNSFNINTIIYPMAWSIAGAAVIFAAIMLIIRADKVRMSDFYRSVLTSVLLLVALPTLVSSLSSLRKAGVSDVSSSFDGSSELADDTTFSQSTDKTLGSSLMANYIYVVDLSIDGNSPVKFSDTTRYTNNPASVYTLPINAVLDTSVYDKKPYELTPPSLEQTAYSELNFIDKLRLIDDQFARASTYSAYNRTTLVNVYETWQARDEHYITEGNINGNTVIFAKTGGGVRYTDEIWVRWYGDAYPNAAPYSQVFEGETIYSDYKNEQEIKEPIPYLGDFDKIDETNYQSFYQNISDAEHDIRWHTYWQYHRTNVYNYQRELLELLNSYFKSNSAASLPAELRQAYTNANFIRDKIVFANSFEDAINNIESTKVYLDDYKGYFSLLEYLNISENYRDYINNETDGGSAQFSELENHSSDRWQDMMAHKILTLGYPDEALYQFHMDIGFGLLTMLITVISLVFAGFKLSSLLFDVLFVQIAAPLFVASDLQGSGRAKQAVQNLISCNICFAVVFFILRIYLKIITEIQTQLPVLVCIFLTLAGAKFVIDGPDLVVKLLGIDAGVKSGAATLMGIRSAMQITSSVSNGAKNAVTAPAKIAGSIQKAAAAPAQLAGSMSAAARDISQAEGFTGKVGAAFGNTSAGQAFRQASNNQNRTNDEYNGYRSENSNSGSSQQADTGGASGEAPKSPSPDGTAAASNNSDNVSSSSQTAETSKRQTNTSEAVGGSNAAAPGTTSGGKAFADIKPGASSAANAPQSQTPESRSSGGAAAVSSSSQTTTETSRETNSGNNAAATGTSSGGNAFAYVQPNVSVIPQAGGTETVNIQNSENISQTSNISKTDNNSQTQNISEQSSVPASSAAAADQTARADTVQAASSSDTAAQSNVSVVNNENSSASISTSQNVNNSSNTVQQNGGSSQSIINRSAFSAGSGQGGSVTNVNSEQHTASQTTNVNNSESITNNSSPGTAAQPVVIHGIDGHDGADGMNGQDGIGLRGEKGDKGDKGDTAEPPKPENDDND